MWQLVKQVLKSFKSSTLLLIGLFFIAFAIIFATFSSIYLSNNISYSYSTLSSESQGNQAILQTDSDSLKNGTLAYNYDVDLNNPKTPNSNGVYFDDLYAYAADTTSFAYQPTNLYHSSFIKQSGDNNWIFAYYSDDSTNPYFQADGVNDADSMYEARARGILASYGNLVIPSSSSKWRAFGFDLGSSDLQYIVYAINPLTGQTDTSDGDTVNTVGYFDNGYYDDYITLDAGNMKYPTNVTSTLDGSVSGSTVYQEKNGDTATPFFVTSSSNSLWTDINYDLGGESIQEILNSFEAVDGTDDTPDITNILSSFFKSESINIALDKDINWDIASVTPYYDYMKILRDKRYLTNSDTNNPVVASKDFVFRIHLNMDDLTDLQKDTLEYVKDTYGIDEYNDLTSFTYTVNGSWVKSALEDEVSGDSNLDNATFNDLSSLQVGYGSNGVTGWSVIEGWLEDYGTDNLTTVSSELETYEQEFLSAKVMSTIDNIEYKTQKSFTVSDYKTSSDFLVSLKGGSYGAPNQNGDIDNVLLVSGSNIESSYDFLGEKYNYLANSSKDEDISNALLTGEKFGGLSLDVMGDNYSINPDGEYLVNLVNLINDSYFSGVESSDDSGSTALETIIKNLSQSLVTNLSTGKLNVNDYYHLFALVTPEIYFEYTNSNSSWNNPADIFSYNNQNVQFNFSVKGGFSSSDYVGDAILVSPYGNAAVVSEKWLEANDKAVISTTDWNNALQMSSADFATWKASLDSKYTVSINSVSFVIIGTGVSFENAYPIISTSSPIPNPKTESVIYVDDIGYQSLLSTNSAAVQDDYFAIKYTNNSANLNAINAVTSKYANDAYSATDTSDSSNLLTQRISYPEKIGYYVELFAIILIVVLIVIGIYLIYLLIKIYVEKNQVAFGIAKANGVSTWKITLSVSTFGLIIAVISGIVGYIAAYFCQSLFLGILDSYWFIPIIPHNFSFWGFIGGVFWLYVVFLLFVFIGVWRTFRNPINDLLTRSSDLKVNRFLYLFKSKKIPLFALTKFRISLSLSKLTRFLLFIILCSAGLSIISIGTSIPRKFSTSQTDTLENRQYDYRYDLQTPSEQSGLYKIQDYSQLGITDDSLGIYDIYNNSMYEWTSSNYNPYTKLLETDPDVMALRDLDGNVINYTDSSGNTYHKYFSNLLLPSYAGTKQFSTDSGFFRNVVVTKWLLDLEISVGGIYINAWSYISQSFPNDLISRINALSNNFITELLSVSQLKAINDEKQYIIQNSSGDYVLNSDVVVDLSNTTDTSSIRLTDDFLEFVGMVYGDETLSSEDAKIAFGIVPFADLDSSTSETETYTYLDATLDDDKIKIPSLRNSGKTTLTNISQEIIGIKDNSTFVTLKDRNGNSLSDLLSTPVKTDSDGYEVYPLVINQGAAYKYNLSVGDTFKVEISNSYDRYTDTMLGKDPTKTVKFEVMGISSDAFSVSMYTSQTYANEILGLNFSQGASFVGTSSMNTNNVVTTTILGDSSALESASGTYNVNIESYDTSYVPFNGMFSREENPLLVNSLTLMCISGEWSNFTYYTDSNFTSILDYAGSGPIIDFIVPYSTTELDQFRSYLGLSSSATRDDIINALSNKYSTENLEKWLESIFSDPSLVATDSLEYFTTVYDTYVTIFDTLLTVETLLISIFIPLIIIVIMIVSSVMMNDFRKLIAILKTLGYSDRENLCSILITFLPIVIISLAIGLAILASLSIFFNYLVFNIASIYLSPAIDWLSYFYGFIAIVGIVVINFIFVTLYLKHQNLKNSITN